MSNVSRRNNEISSTRVRKNMLHPLMAQWYYLISGGRLSSATTSNDEPANKGDVSAPSSALRRSDSWLAARCCQTPWLAFSTQVHASVFRCICSSGSSALRPWHHHGGIRGRVLHHNDTIY
eukprot:scaffold45119_cov49-Attheya_sp.AAC.3